MKSKHVLLLGALLAVVAFGTGCRSLNTAGGDGISQHMVPETSLSAEARAALTKLTADVPAAAALVPGAKGVMVFPGVVKGGFVVGAFRGEGTLFKNGKLAGYYNTSGASYGLQAGIQQYGYALFFMTDSALHDVDAVQGFEIGVGPSVVVVDAGMGKSVTTTTAKSDVYAFIFDQKGLMAGLGLQGSKIYRIDR
jgi:lipid-binding SYLF domain-containing protein